GTRDDHQATWRQRQGMPDLCQLRIEKRLKAPYIYCDIAGKIHAVSPLLPVRAGTYAMRHVIPQSAGHQGNAMVTVVKCPTCRRDVRWEDDSKWRPFCS